MKYIPLTKGKKSLVDDIDFNFLSSMRWYLGSDGYAYTGVYKDGKTKQYSMHRLLMNTPIGKYTDHVNGNKLDNRKCNLRICTNAENIRNQKKKGINTSGYKGVSWHKQLGVWRAQIRVNYKAIHLGCYKTKEEAYNVYKDASDKYFGIFANI